MSGLLLLRCMLGRLERCRWGWLFKAGSTQCALPLVKVSLLACWLTRVHGLLRAGVTSYGSQFCMTNALRYARAAPALAMSYISIVLTTIYGYYVFDEVPALSFLP